MAFQNSKNTALNEIWRQLFEKVPQLWDLKHIYNAHNTGQSRFSVIYGPMLKDMAWDPKWTKWLGSKNYSTLQSPEKKKILVHMYVQYEQCTDMLNES